MNNHTPGPWTVAAESGDFFPTLLDYSPIPSTWENATLMAAAPELLKALLMSQRWMEAEWGHQEGMHPHDREIFTETMSAIHDALAKATAL